MPTPIRHIACVADHSTKAKAAYEKLAAHYNFVPVERADVIVALGGDGFMLRTMHDYMDSGKPIYGMNCGTVGFLLNNFRTENLVELIDKATPYILHPLKMIATDQQGKVHEAYAINEVSLLRQTRQTARLKIKVDGHMRMESLMCDGILVSTAAGSTAYNLSAHGPIVPIGSDLLALTPISPFRPRRWRGALLKHKVVIEIEVTNSSKRPVSSVADFTEVRDVISVKILEDRQKSITLLFDSGHSLEERIISEQFIG